VGFDVLSRLLSWKSNIDHPFVGSTMLMSARLMGGLLIRTLTERPMENNMSHSQKKSHRGHGIILLSRVWVISSSRQLDTCKA
jgi:hypothetical protein